MKGGSRSESATELSYNTSAAHVWSQRFRDHDTAVLLLEVLEYRGDRAPDRESRAVQGVYELRL